MICRLCNSNIDGSKILTLAPMPSAAQSFLDLNELKYDKSITLNIYKCNYCGLIQLSNMPVPYFKEVIRATTFSESAKKIKREEFIRLIKKYNLLNNKTLEIGAATGDVVELLNEVGLDAEGLEYSQSNVEYAIKRNRNVKLGYILDIDSTFNSKYDFIISINYIEHQPNTQQFIRKIYHILKTNGLCYITAPNVEYLLNTYTLYEFVADHLVYFDKYTIQRAFEINGFDILESGVINNQNDVYVVAKKREIHPIQEMTIVYELISKLKNIIRNHNQRNENVAIWGAGHRTLALLSLGNIKNISCIVDSAPFKQNKFSPITHIKIISPSELLKSDVKVVLVMLPGIYPDEVITFLQEANKRYIIYKLDDNDIIKI